MAGIYIHIPFCRQACTYCNFHFSTSLRHKNEMLQAIQQELAMQASYLNGQAIETIYFGGGTPSLLSADEINRITDTVMQHYTVVNLKEFTLETNPDDLSYAYIKSLKSTLVNRFSIGIQSFRDNDLQYMNRAHNAQQAEASVKTAQDAGFENITIDLIYGTPKLSDEDWKNNLDRVREYSIPHFSAYALTVEEGTALHHNIKHKKTIPVDAAQAAAQFEILMAYAADNGYEHYEISNFALPDMYAVHNTNYWMGVPYLGIGPSAHSYNGNARRWNIANNALYLKSILQQRTVPYEEEVLTTEQRVNEYVMTSLRTMWGCDLDKITKQYGEDYSQSIASNAQAFYNNGQMIAEGNKLILTQTGKLFADNIAATLFI
ncbi:coproporphyrinogen III oxidase [Chitinophagaceae bacterium IBVUCB1]|nr:coproporphyrinogen III oxidase [Chitinophagaceae bacterium IBVUCB1]